MANRRHERQYSGWDEAGASDGMVRQYDTTRMRWVELDLEDVPGRVIARHRGADGSAEADGSPEPDNSSEPPSGPTQESGPAAQTGEIVDVELVLESAQTKHAVESFVVTVENQAATPLTVDRAGLTFDDEPEKSAPIEAVVLESGETAAIEVHWSWIHQDQDVLTVGVRSGSEPIAMATVDLDDYR
ncbi:hypothetical protein C483_03999 [Natrialba hulunbeirensis JCM 10989]|uniref:Uncharacterized protein n=1 Tax=Natrialba hulunbeirensis JCM 10989 TaxID=1227493 RepID=M0A5F7_9EURY|nr:hypothetical protein [Natrialba hulunbeirensis]ELY93809.1 hypothetical protein C483_03999 [Natrialba hulunbeirensis JCM 10989]